MANDPTKKKKSCFADGEKASLSIKRHAIHIHSLDRIRVENMVITGQDDYQCTHTYSVSSATMALRPHTVGIIGWFCNFY